MSSLGFGCAKTQIHPWIFQLCCDRQNSKVALKIAGSPSAHVPSLSYLIKHNLGAAAVKDFANKIKAVNQLTLKQKAHPWWA